MSKSGSVIWGLTGLIAGESIVDQLVEDNNILGHVVTGIAAAGVVGAVSKIVVDETGVGDFIDDLLGF